MLNSNLIANFFLSVLQYENRDSVLSLPTLKESVYQNYEKLAGPLREDFDEGQIERIFKVQIHSLTTIRCTKLVRTLFS